MMQAIFCDPSLERLVHQSGYASGPLLNADGLGQLREGTRDLMPDISKSGQLQNGFLSAGRLDNSELRQRSADLIKAIVVPALESYFLPGAVRLIAGVHQIKPPGLKGRLNPHQDSSHVDERRELAVYAWVPLEDTDLNNGTLALIPGSHRFGIPQRSLNIPWPLRHPLHQMMLRQFMRPLTVRAGQVVFFHSALIHGSGPNRTGVIRLAVNCLIIPNNSFYRHYYRDHLTHPGFVEVFSVNPDFFYKENITARPSEKWPKLGEELWVDRRIRLTRLAGMLHQKG